MTSDLLQALTAELSEKLQNEIEQNPAYLAFLQAVTAVEQEISRMNSPDRYGRLPIVDRAHRDKLMRLHQQIGIKAEGVFRGESDKVRKDLVKKITALAAGNHRALLTYDPEKEPKILPILLSEVRTLTLDTRGAALKSKIGNVANIRQPITFLDDKGREITGVFTPKTEMHVRDSIQGKIDQIKNRVRDPVGRRILDGFLDKLISWGAAQMKVDLDALPESRKMAMLDPFAQRIATGPKGNQLDRDAMKQTMEELFTEELRGARITSKIPKKLLWELGQSVCDQFVNINANLGFGKIPDGSRLDNRNAAMSAMADLLGVPKLLARSRPMKLVMPDGTEVEGTFMLEGQGLDPQNLSEEAAGIDKNACVAKTADEKAAVSKGFKDLADLQILDYLCGNVDRRWANMLYQFTEGKKFRGVQGIDNDCSLGLTMPAADQAEKEMAALEDMKVISASMEKAVMELTPDTLRFCLQGFDLSQEELDAAAHRLNTLKEKLAADKQVRMHGTGLVDGFIRVIQDNEWADYSMKDLCKTVRIPDPTPKDPNHTKVEPANIFATARSPIYEMSDDYHMQRMAYQSLKSEVAIGADNRANPVGLHKTGARTMKLLDLLQKRTTQGRSSPQYDAMLTAVEKYCDLQMNLSVRMNSAQAHPEDPDAAFESIVSTTDLEELRLLAKNVKDTAQAYLTRKGDGLHFGYTARRIEAAKLALALGTKGAEISQAEAETAERNEITAMAELRQRAGNQMEAAEQAGVRRPWGADDFLPAPAAANPAGLQQPKPQENLGGLIHI